MKQLLSILLFSLFFLTAHSQVRTKNEILEKIQDKTLEEIKEEFKEIKQEVEASINLSNIRISGGPVNDTETKYTVPYTAKEDVDLAEYYSNRLSELEFSQEIKNNKTELSWLNDFYLIVYPRSFNTKGLENPKILLDTIYYYDGTKQHTSLTNYNTVNTLKKIDSISILYKYQRYKKAEFIELNNKQNKSNDGKLFLSLIEDHKIELQIDSILESNILYIEALDAKGKPLWEKSTFKSKSNIKSQEKYLEEVILFLTNAIEKIETKEITTKEKYAEYIYNYQPRKEIKIDYTPKTILFNSYAGKVSTIKVYLNPGIVNVEKRLNITNSTIYSNGVTVGSLDNNDGLIDKAGKWVIKPIYRSITHKLLNHYTVTKENDRLLHQFNKEKKELKPVPYIIKNTEVYNNKYIEIFVPTNHNRKTGLLDTETLEYVLKPEERELKLKKEYYISIKESDTASDFFEVYRFADHKKIFEDHFYKIEIDNDLFIVEHIEETSKDASRYIHKKGKYYSYYYDIYNNEGVKLNKESINYFPDKENFGKDELLLVNDSKDQIYFIDKKLRKQKFKLKRFKQVKSFSNGFAAVQDHNNKWGYINTKGDIVIPLKYSRANYFIGNSALIMFNSQSHLIDTNGKVIFTFSGNIIRYSSEPDATKATYTIQSGQLFNHLGKLLN